MKLLSLHPTNTVFLLRNLCFVLLMLSSTHLSAQDFTIRGKIISNLDKQPLESATVYVNNIKDSALVAYTISDKNGIFEMEGRTKAQHLDLLVSFVGYKTYKKKIETPEESLDLGIIAMELEAEELEGVSVVATRAPITVKKDTLEFNADSFKLKPDASVEDLLKRLPGVEVALDGKITVNGKPVNEILVNGKPFFSDPKIATKNLTKEIVKKIQISDTKTESEKFTGKSSDGENKSINIELKEGKDKGMFGRLTGGYGTDKRYETSGIFNHFKGKRFITLLASSNNINSSGFGYDEVFDAMGSSARSVSVSSDGAFSINGMNFGGGQGITTSSNIGMNYVNEFGKENRVSGDYFYNTSNSENHTKVKRETFLPDRHYFTESSSSFEGDVDNHRVSSQFEFRIDSTFRIYARPSFSYGRTQNHNESNEMSFNDSNVKINESTSQRNVESYNKHFENDLSMVKKFGAKGAFLRVSFENSNASSDSDAVLYNKREIYGQTRSTSLRDQISNTDSESNSYSLRFDYRQPLIGKLFLDAEYNVDWQNETNKEGTYDADAAGNYTEFNKALSSDFESKETQHTPTLGLNYEGEKFRLRTSAGLIYTRLFNEDKLQQVAFEKDFYDIRLMSRIRYEISQGSHFNFAYRTNSRTPSAQQLQPINNIDNPLHTYIGNPDLKRQFTHSIYSGFNSFNYKTQSGVFLSSNMTWTEDKITPITTTDEDLLRETTYTNLNGDFNGNIYATYRKTIKTDANRFSYGLGVGGSYSKVNQFLNSVLMTSKNLSVIPRVQFSYNIEDLLDNELEYSLSYNTTKYSLSNLDNQSFNAHNVKLVNTLYLPRNIIFGNDISYSYNSRIAEGFDKSVLFWNMSLGVKMLEEKATLKLKAYDLLNQNNNVRRVINEDYIQDSEGTILRRYFMLSFTYKFNTIGGKNSAPNRGGGRVRVRRF